MTMFAPSFRHRRWLASTFTLLLFAFFVFWVWIEESRLDDAAFLTGCTVLAGIILLILLGLRRRLPVLPLGSVSVWTQVHLYLGFFTAGVYLIHVPVVLGSGWLEGGLSLAFIAVTLSGFYGLYASRQLPKRLTAVEGQHRLDRVGWHRGQIAETARCLLDELQEPSAHSVLGRFYQDFLNPFFGSSPSLAYVLVPSGVRRRRLLNGLRELDRYLEREGRDTAGRFAALVRRRDDLDYQYALQLRLRLWLVLHSTLSIALLVGGIVHGVIAWRCTS
jgi:hypothetical protein